MTPPPSLTPVPITDKNGVQTTRWKRSDPTGKPSASIPPVSTPASPIPVEKTREELRALELKKFPFSTISSPTYWYALNPQRSKNATIDRYLDFPADMRENITRALSRKNTSMVTIAMVFVKMIAGRSTDDKMIDDVATYVAGADENNLTFIRDMFRSNSDTEVQYQPLQIDITGLRQYRLKGFDYDQSLPIRKQSETTQEQIAALFKLHSYAYSLPTYMESGLEPLVNITANNVIEPYWLARYAAERPDKTDALIDIIRERETTNEDIIRSVLGNESPSMMSGVL